MKLPNAYQTNLLIEVGRVVLISDRQLESIYSVRRGVLFILARWSGASQLAFRALNMALASLPDLNGVCLYVADTDDDKTEELLRAFGDTPAGAGETYWLLDGKVRHKLAGYKDEALPILREYTRDILASDTEERAEQRTGTEKGTA